jgi:hypothetical protein
VLFFLPVGPASLRLAIASVIMFAWTTALFVTVRAALGNPPASSAVAR